MLSLCRLTFTLLFSLPLLSSVLAIQCNETQYPWPLKAPKFCCTKCSPGYFMARTRHSESSCDIKCDPCKDGQYTDTYNTDMTCKFCKTCNGDNMKLKSKCRTSHDTMCECEDGYECKDHDCTQCVSIPTTTRPTTKPTTRPTNRSTLRPSTALTTTEVTPSPMKDTVWFLVIIALLCAGLGLVIATKIKPFLRWIRSNHGYFLSEKTAQQAEDEDVSKPVQEVCGKCDQLIELCIKD